MRTVHVPALLVIAMLGLGAAAIGCRSLEGASQDVTNGFRDTQQDLQHGIRGTPDPNAPPSATSSAQPRPTAPPGAVPATPAPQPAPTNSGVTL
jgi:hypothetical protein